MSKKKSAFANHFQKGVNMPGLTVQDFAQREVNNAIQEATAEEILDAIKEWNRKDVLENFLAEMSDQQFLKLLEARQKKKSS